MNQYFHVSVSFSTVTNISCSGTSLSIRNFSTTTSSSGQKSAKQQPLQRVHAYLTEKIGTNGIVNMLLALVMCITNLLYYIYLGRTHCFDSSKSGVGYQHFKYVPRIWEENTVCNIMRTRWQHRRSSSNTRTRGAKKHNPLICITGAVGDGKSAFIANFPVSASYRKYLQERYPTVADPQPIVAMYSLEGQREGPPEIGLRILHGALASMSVIDDLPVYIPYRKFRDELFPNLAWNNKYNATAAPLITVQEAVELLWEFFGKERPILLLHDKTSTIKDINQAQLVLDSLHELVIKYNNIDVIVSAFSHQYTAASPPRTPQKYIKYVQLQPLPQVQEMVVLTRKWAKYIRDRYETNIGRIMNIEVFRLLTVAYIMAGHHPRSVDYLSEWFQECIEDKYDVFTHNELANIENLLTSDIWDRNSYSSINYREYKYEQPELIYGYLNTKVFTKKRKSILTSGLFWSNLTRTNIKDNFAWEVQRFPWYNAIYPSELFILQSRFFHQKQYYSNKQDIISSKYRNLIDFQNIFVQHEEDHPRLATILSKCVIMSALTTIRETKQKEIALSTVFGCVFPTTKTIMKPDSTLRVISATTSLHGPVLEEGKDCLLIPPDTEAGYSALFHLHESPDKMPLYAYLTIPNPAAVAGEPQQDLSQVLLSAVKNIFHAHSQRTASAGVNFFLSSGGVNPNKALLEQLYVIFYDAGNPMESMALDYAALQEVAQEQLTRAAEHGLEAQSPAADKEETYLPVVLEFLQHHQGNLQVVTQPQLRDFLIPSFVPLMELTNHVYGPEDL